MWEPRGRGVKTEEPYEDCYKTLAIESYESISQQGLLRVTSKGEATDWRAYRTPQMELGHPRTSVHARLHTTSSRFRGTTVQVPDKALTGPVGGAKAAAKKTVLSLAGELAGCLPVAALELCPSDLTGTCEKSSASSS
jgi:hypothetical protein